MSSIGSAIVEKGIGIGVGLLLGALAAEIVGYSGPGGLLLAVADDLLMVFFKQGLSAWEGFNLSIFMDESEKIIHEAIVYSEEDDRQRAARHAALVRWHGDRTYLFGDVSVADFLRLAYSGFTVYKSPLFGSISEWVGGGSDIVAEGLEVATLL